MTEHIGADLAEYLTGQLSPDREAEIRRHLAACTECAADAKWVEELRHAGAADNRIHLRAERIVQLAGSGAPAPTDAEAAHLAGCASCGAELEWARRTPGVDVASVVPIAGVPATSDGTPRALAARRGWTWAAAALATAAALVLIFMPRDRRIAPTDPARLAALAHIEPLPVRLTRSGAAPGSFESKRQLGLEAYADSNYTAARTNFEEAVALQPGDAEVRLYAASAALLAGDPRTGRQHLESVAQQSTEGALQQEALWLLGNTELLLGQPEAAREVLQRLAGTGGRHAPAARALLEAMRRAANGS